jgi:signal transduction histidine kinase
VAHVRRELTRIVTDLRLSIFDLRSHVSSTAGLGRVLSDFVRQVGARSGMTVHLSLDEGQERLRVEVEEELLRIAQEAVTNARKHSAAANLWVSCRVRPPAAYLEISDDGIGISGQRDNTFGLKIMRERGRRIGAEVILSDRIGGGTRVSVSLGSNYPLGLPGQRAAERESASAPVPALAHSAPDMGPRD